MTGVRVTSAPAYADVSPGDVLPARQFVIEREDLLRYAGASGDFNVIHWSDLAAARAGLPGVIAHGMLTMALAARVVTDWAGSPGRVVDYTARFSRAVPVREEGEVRVEVEAWIRDKLGDGLVAVELTARCDGRKVLSSAVTTVRLG
jgi:acyl dehydratase